MVRPALKIVAAALLLLIAGVVAGGLWLRSQLETPYLGHPEGKVFVEIPRHATPNRVADRLVRSGVLRNRLPFLIYLRYTGVARRVQAGEYLFDKPATPAQVAQRLARGDVYFRSITIPEGLTAWETIELLAAKGLGEREEMERLIGHPDLIRDLDPDAQSLEGYLFPETYRFRRGVDSETIIASMVQQFRGKFAKLTALHPLRGGWNASSIVTLASLIEKEVKDEKERPLVASVLMNRLQRRMPLAVDATIIYAMKLAGTWRGNLSRADLVMDSPYNSYRHQSLPPGPIANPGESSLRAAINPATTDYLFYVSRNDGTHEFSGDYRSHQRAVNRFQRSRSRRSQ